MAKQYFTLIVLLLVVISNADQQVPLRKGEYGFSIGDKPGNLHIEFFIDLLCPDSKESYNTMIEVMKTVDFAQQGVRLTYQFNPLSWHFYSFKVQQAFFFVLENSGSLQAEKFISYVFAHQDDFAEEKWLDKTLSQFLDSFATTIATNIKVDRNALRTALDGRETWNTARYHWKYTVGMNFVPGAPLFNVNSVRVDGGESFTAAQWISIIKQYKNSQLTRMDPPTFISSSS